MLEILQLPVLNDNYIYLIHDNQSMETAVVDPALADPVLAVLEEKQWQLTAILNTHHHSDHVGGNETLKQKTGCTIYGPKKDQHRIPGIDIKLSEQDIVKIGAHPAHILETPGHTNGHLVYHFYQDDALFCGDTLFVIGCGRLFEGTPEQMFNSLNKLKQLPGATKIYCAHEYTLNNAEFALTVEPDNAALQQTLTEVQQRRSKQQPTVPSTIHQELLTNPFLRSESEAIKARLNLHDARPVEVFAEIRSRKDRF